MKFFVLSYIRSGRRIVYGNVNGAYVCPLKTNSNQEQNNKLYNNNNNNSNNVNINNITSCINTNNNHNNAIHATEIEALKNIDQKLIDTIMSEVAKINFFY